MIYRLEIFFCVFFITVGCNYQLIEESKILEARQQVLSYANEKIAKVQEDKIEGSSETKNKDKNHKKTKKSEEEKQKEKLLNEKKIREEVYTFFGYPKTIQRVFKLFIKEKLLTKQEAQEIFEKDRIKASKLEEKILPSYKMFKSLYNLIDSIYSDLESKFQKNPELLKLMNFFLQDFISLGNLEKKTDSLDMENKKSQLTKNSLINIMSFFKNSEKFLDEKLKLIRKQLSDQGIESK